ncbi:MAG: peptidase C10 streptopain [Bacteroidetes bacterium]|nr:MAG: peptidase C10 streptopain [Bacteroidota bacterium]
MIAMKKPILFFFLVFLLIAGINSVTAQVSPLTSTTWNQGCNYNTDCPADGAGACGHVYTGCGATAYAQMLKYHAFPPAGWGSHSYTAGSYGLQSANYAATSYNWTSMPNALSSMNADVAQLMYHCGVALDMGYGPSGSYCSANSQVLKQYFKYSLSVRGALQSQYTSTAWENLVISELNAGRVVFASGGAHFYIIDGYQTTPSLKFHLNFGWGGFADGYYDIHNVVVSSTNFTPYSVIVGIKPLAGLEASPDTVTVGSGGGNANYEVASLATNWTASTADSWITPALLSGGPGFYNYTNGASATIGSHSLYTPRYGSVTYTDGSTTKNIVVKQNGIQPFLYCAQNNLTYSSSSSMQTVNISCDSNWTVTPSAPWITVTPISGTGNGSIDITVAGNPSTSTRIGTVIVTRNNLQQVINITQAGSGSFWCTPAMITPGTNGITNVTLNTLNRTSAINEGYINTSTGTTLKIDTSYTIYVTFSGGNAPAVWIDWNIDGDFGDPGEAVVSPSGTWYPSFSSTKNMAFTVPATAVEGVTRMRVYAKAFGTGPVSGPCNTTDNGGDIEDYDITVMNQRHIWATPSSLSYLNAGGTQNVTIDCDSAWTVNSPASWISFTAGSGSGNGTNGVITTANTSTVPRTASVTYTRGTRTAVVAVYQDGADTILLANTLAATIPNSGGTQNVIMTSNVAYTMTSSQSWITTSVSSGSGNGSFDIIVSSNPTPLIRTGNVTVQSGTFTQVISITQDSTSTVLNVAPPSLNYSSAGGVQSFSITTSSGWTASTGDSWIGIDQNSGSGNATINVTATMNGTTSIRTGSVTVTNGLVLQVVTVTQDSMITTGVKTYGANGLHVYPNPANDFITIESSEYVDAQLQLFDATGRLVLEGNMNSGRTMLSTSELGKGMYLLLVKENGSVVAQHRLIIQH